MCLGSEFSLDVALPCFVFNSYLQKRWQALSISKGMWRESGSISCLDGMRSEVECPCEEEENAELLSLCGWSKSCFSLVQEIQRGRLGRKKGKDSRTMHKDFAHLRDVCSRTQAHLEQVLLHCAYTTASFLQKELFNPSRMQRVNLATTSSPWLVLFPQSTYIQIWYTLKTCHHPGRNINFPTQTSSTQVLFGSGKHKSCKLKTPGPIPQQGHLPFTQALPLCRKYFIKQANTTRIILLLRKQNSREVPLPANGGDPLG